MTITVTPEIEQMIAARVASGRFASPEEVLRESLRLLEEQERALDLERQAIRQKIALGMEQARRGELIDGKEVIRELLAELDDDAGE
jgi:antitoxin ParD1/3/4